jgi:hypothetical protein
MKSMGDQKAAILPASAPMAAFLGLRTRASNFPPLLAGYPLGRLRQERAAFTADTPFRTWNTSPLKTQTI